MLLVITALIVGTVIVWRTSGDQAPSRRATSPRPTPTHLPTRAVVDADGLVTTLPDVPAIIRPELSPRLRAGEMINGNIADAPPSDSQVFIWISFSVRYGRYLRVSVARSSDPRSAHAELARRKRKANQHTSAGGWKTDTGPARPFSGLGEDAFSVHETQQGSPQADADRPDRRYDIGGGYFCVRFRNVVISVDVMGADYPPDAAKNIVLHGTLMSYQESRREALPLIKAIIGHLS